MERTSCEGGGHSYDAVDLRSLAMAASNAGCIDQHVDLRADEVTTASRRDGVLQLGQLRHPLDHQRLRDDAVEVGGVRAVLARELEEATPIELRIADEGQQAVVIGFGLTG